jgi:hypothetical protein
MAEPIFRAPMGDAADAALERGLVGIGDAGGNRAKAQRILERFAALPDGTFVWTRDAGGAFHLGRLAGPAADAATAPALPPGLRHVRPTAWLERPFGELDVPAAVAATFARGGRNFQRTHDAAAERATAALWAAAG